MKTILLLFGGRSNEYEVSLRSAYSVINNIPSDKYTIETVGITKEGKWLLYCGGRDKIPSGKWIRGECYSASLSADFGSKQLLVFDSRGGLLRKIHIDVCFPVLHGKNGEDGTLQGMLEIAGIPYVGCGTLSSAMCMDKEITNLIADHFRFPQAKWLSITKFDYEKKKEKFIAKCVSYLGLPLFIKPANAGSSVGISKVKSEDEMEIALETAFKEDSKIVAEECIVGREIECSVLGNEDPFVSVPGEIRPLAEFYDYKAKYVDEDTELCIPADLPPETVKTVRKLALKAFKVLGCKGLARVDFFLRSSDNKVLFNEINTLPGFTSISMFAMLLEESGISYGETVEKLIELAGE
ncbi:MAG: D-alanine--D-alanine ligase [Clostridiales bacterium]|nr:D-alanine--D-alanine ligase [Clostridiales bacterium]